MTLRMIALLICLGFGLTAQVPHDPPDYDNDNPIVSLTQTARSVQLAGGQQQYHIGSLHYLFPLESFGIPEDDPTLETDGRNSTKQALRRYELGDYSLVKGWVNFGGGRRNFLHVDYRCDPTGNSYSGEMRLSLGVGSLQHELPMGFDRESGCYQLEIWAVPAEAEATLSGALRALVQEHRLHLDETALPGNPLDYVAERLQGTLWDVGDPNDINHPLRPAGLTLTFREADKSGDGPHEVAFKMVRRGYDAFRTRRWGNNPHGGTGSTRGTVFYVSQNEEPDGILRALEPGDPMANGLPAAEAATERFYPAKYMMLVEFGPSASIGIHRHTHFMDSFWVFRGSGMAVIADAVPIDGTEPTVELRRLHAFEGFIARPGQMHGMLRDSDEELEIFAFGTAN